jgi:hypothetical protein
MVTKIDIWLGGNCEKIYICYFHRYFKLKNRLNDYQFYDLYKHFILSLLCNNVSVMKIYIIFFICTLVFMDKLEELEFIIDNVIKVY